VQPIWTQGYCRGQFGPEAAHDSAAKDSPAAQNSFSPETSVMNSDAAKLRIKA